MEKPNQNQGTVSSEESCSVVNVNCPYCVPHSIKLKQFYHSVVLKLDVTSE